MEDKDPILEMEKPLALKKINEFPPQIEVLFKPNKSIKFYPKISFSNNKGEFEGVTNYLEFFEKKNDREKIELPIPKWKEKTLRHKEKQKNHKISIKKEMKNWDPKTDPKIKTDPYNTLFLCRLSYYTTEEKLRKEFEEFGKIKSVRIVKDLEGKSRGYAFLEFETAEAMKTAYRYSEHKAIDGRKIIVDVERSRVCLPKWKPRRFGGGLGDTRKAKKPKKELERIARHEKANKASQSLFGRGRGRRGRGGGRGRRGFGGRRRGGGGRRSGGFGRRNYGGGRRGYGRGGGGSGNRDRDRGRYGSGGDRFGGKRDREGGGIEYGDNRSKRRKYE